MRKVILYTKDRKLHLEGISSVEDLDENVSHHIILMDIDTVGFSLLPDLREENLLIAVTGRTFPGYIMKLISLGFFDVLQKPVDKRELREILRKAYKELKREGRIVYLPKDENESLKGELCEELCSIVGGYKSMKEILRMTGKAAAVDSPVLLTGESGTGKELFAKAIWKLSSRWRGPFVAVNCSAIPESLLEAELFGYEKGAFTGAVEQKKGLIESANHGILFLDEIGDLPPSLQPKLLRVIQERKIRRLGGTREIPVNFRLISATNKDLKRLMKEGRFREDLYYRIASIHIHLPPLRERRSDIQDLVNCILRRISKETGKPVKGYTEGFLEKILNYPWPGNIRELENKLRKAIAVNVSGVLGEEDLHIDYETQTEKDEFEEHLRTEVRKLLSEKPGEVYHDLMERISRIVVDEALKQTDGNKQIAAKLLGINRLTLRRKLG